MQVKKIEIKNFIIAFFIQKDGKSILNKIEKMDLIDMGLLDSLDLVTISFEIEKKFKIKINPSTQETLNNFKNLNKMVNYVFNKLKK